MSRSCQKKNNRAAPVFGLDFFDALPMPEGAESTVASQIEQWQADKQIPPKAVVTQSVTSKLDAINRNISGALAGTVDSLLRAPEAAGIALSGSKIPTGIIADAMKAIGTGVDVGNYHVAGLSDLADATSAKLQNYALNSDNVRAQKSAIADVEKKVLDGQVGALGDLTWDQVAGAVAGAVPSLALSAIAPELALITGGAQGAGGALKDARDYEKRTGQKLTDEQMAKSIAVSAAVNSIGEKIGVDAAMGKLGVNKLISDKLGAGIIARAANGVVGAVGEGGTEIAQTVGENYGKQIGYDANQRLSEGVLESALGGIGAGGAMGAIHRPTASQATNAREAATMPMTEIMDDVGMPSMHGQRYVQPIAPITPVNVDYAAAAATETALLAQQQAADLGESMAETPAPTATTEQQDTAQHSTAQYSTAQPSLTLEQAHTRRSAANKLIERLESSAENETALTAIQQSPVYQRAQNVLNTARQVIHEHEVQQQAQAKQDSAELAQRMTQRMTIDPYQGLSNQQQVIQDVNQSRIADALANYEADKQGDLGAQMANLRQLPQRMKIDPSMALSDQQQVINEVAAARKDGTLLPELKDSMADGRRKPTPHTMTIDPYQGYSDQQEAAFRAKAVADTTLQKQMADGREQLERKRDMSQKIKMGKYPNIDRPNPHSSDE
ncbi:hypothetical protein [Deefgea sp. CFH1-16]|uniref:hypothetical protein n=1 Tax=Deefgea sp. CFH1-16 TaxID=2675457 RepID=UPI0015F4CA24|nr:hypothetical protein [Deefgea sp. CFH1-16]MBM5575842.1 hypothetical protein [Deefgea sp. CFH1-16]